MATSSSPTARRLELARLELARRLKELREAAGKSLADVAEELECSLAKASRLESGQRAAQALDIKVLSRFYGVTPGVQAELGLLAAEARKPGWWQDYRTLDEQTKTYIGLETAATEMLHVEVLRMPGLVQTPEYARAWVQEMRPPGFWKAGDVDQIAEARLRRQQRVVSGDLRLRALVDERAFALVFPGSPEIMREQTRHLISEAGRGNVVLQLIPLATGPHAGLDGSFQLLRFETSDLDDLVYVEGQFGNLILEKADVVRRYHEVFDHLSSAVALSAEDTLTWLHHHLKSREAAGPTSRLDVDE
jgi:transcriptional regulator with XRE-family HTH domain